MNRLVVIYLLFVFLFGACAQVQNPYPPELTIIPDTVVEAKMGQIVPYTLNIYSAEDLTTLKIKSNVRAFTKDTTFKPFTHQNKFKLYFQVPDNDMFIPYDSVIKIEFILSDTENQTTQNRQIRVIY